MVERPGAYRLGELYGQEIGLRRDYLKALRLLENVPNRFDDKTESRFLSALEVVKAAFEPLYALQREINELTVRRS